MVDSTKLYGWLLRFYPARFREEYQGPMERQFRDEYREVHGFKEFAGFWLRTILDLAASVPAELSRELTLDLKHSIRIYRKRPLTTALGIIALALAIGSSTGVFSVLNAVLLRSLPFSNPAELVELVLSPTSAMNGRAAFVEWYSRSPYLESAATFTTSEMNLTQDRDALRVKVAETSANLFQLLGVKAVVGRTFTPAEDIEGHGGLAVISYGLWQQLFAGDPGVGGRTLRVNGTAVTIIGVAPPSFDYPEKTNVWLPTVFDFEKTPKRGAFLVRTIGRLKRGVSLQSARKVFEAECRRVNRQLNVTLDTAEQDRPRLVSLRNQLAGPVQRASWVLAGMTLFVLLTACANIAQLLLSRATERRQELALRAALGASRARLLQQLITEASVLTITGALLGLFVAYWTSGIVSSVAPAQLQTQQYTILDWRVLCFAILLAIAMAIVVGVLPVWLRGRLQSSSQLMRSQPGTRDLATKRVRSGLLFMQAALALTLITSSLTMGRTFLQLINTNLGFRPASVVTLNTSLQGTRYQGPGEWQYYSQALSQLRAVPGVQAAGAVSHLPLASDIYMAFPFKLDSGESLQRIAVNSVTPGYFKAMKTSFLAGRDFAENEKQYSEAAVIVNEAFAQATKLGTAIVGRKMTAPWNNTYRIVGLVATTRTAGPASAGQPQIYWPVEDEPPPALTLVARVDGPAEPYLARCGDAVRMVDRAVPIYDVKTLDQRRADVLSRPKFYTTATLFLAVLAILLAAVGIFGTAAYAIAQRRHEMGVRMAIGASYQRIRNMILRESLLPIAYGTGAGILFSIASGRYLQHLLENASPPGFWTAVAAAGVLLSAGTIAAWSATARVLAIDPIDAIRAE